MKTQEINCKNLLQKIADYQAKTVFVEDFIKEDNFEERQEDGLGIALAKWAEWDGIKIMRVFYYALEDANFHEEARLIEEMIEYYPQPLEGE